MNNSFCSIFLILKNGIKFEGYSFSNNLRHIVGEIVFTTSMVGYVEALTDPSYTGQILCFTYPLIGNYGVPSKKFWESKKIQVSGVIISSAFNKPQHAQSIKPFLNWLDEHNIPYIMGVDTRHLTQIIRNEGSLLGAITTNPDQLVDFIDPNTKNLVAQASVSKKVSYGSGEKKIIAIDCGMKSSQIKYLTRFPLEVIRVPYDYDFLKDEFDGLFISNGPGNPTMCKKTIGYIREALTIKKPIFGICLGMQLLAAANGCKIYKLPYGHRGQNQPCMDIVSKKCYITSQNHGYAVENILPKNWVATFINLNDQTLEGIRHTHLPYFAVQFHPEAHGGPRDTSYLFEEFYNLL